MYILSGSRVPRKRFWNAGTHGAGDANLESGSSISDALRFLMRPEDARASITAAGCSLNRALFRIEGSLSLEAGSNICSAAFFRGAPLSVKGAVSLDKDGSGASSRSGVESDDVMSSGSGKNIRFILHSDITMYKPSSGIFSSNSSSSSGEMIRLSTLLARLTLGVSCRSL